MSDSNAGVQEKGIRLSNAEQSRRRTRSVAIALVLAGLVALFYVVTLAKIGSNLLERSV